MGKVELPGIYIYETFFISYRRSKQPPNKETAFTKAIISAAIVHAVTRNCSKGEIKDCGCDSRIGNPSYVPYTEDNTMNISRTLQEEIEVQETKWSWGGCSDDPKYAIEVAKKLLNGLEKGSDAAVYVARHNNKVGRDIIKDTMTKRCRCHGVSGSCSLQTCWVQVSHFRIIAKKLNEKYIKAVKFTQERVEKAIIPGNSLRDISEEREIRGSEKKLVYLEESPDYCIPNEAEDFPGTKGRICSRNQLEQASISERKSCRKLCRGCGHRVRKIKKEVKKRCNCIFAWCCEVKCDTCIETVEEHFCN
ncbi:hypothetical protein NQ317_003681 [Molorchus minor]|uniref:Protein Wnt n=1 Tax=Molorchus minor TaxID=1323400 RepID=A0ABQ9JNU6_9CUCU|nr:hypothetical protein NQ317_003681 [Molorchus minor]